MIPSCPLAFIGGSSTLSLDLPSDLGLDYLESLEEGLVFPTPFGDSPPFQLFRLEGPAGPRRVLSCAMHGWRDQTSRGDASRQVFWVLRQAGVDRIIAEGGVGAVNHLLQVRDLVVASDYIDVSLRKDVKLDNRYLLIMRDALCPSLRRAIYDRAREQWPRYVFPRGVYVNTEGRHFESPAEIQAYKLSGADIVGQSICPEVYLAREIGACYAGIYMVVNYAEGIVEAWRHEELAEIFHTQGVELGRLIFSVLRDLPLEDFGCQCGQLRKATLLSSVYQEEV